MLIVRTAGVTDTNTTVVAGEIVDAMTLNEERTTNRIARNIWNQEAATITLIVRTAGVTDKKTTVVAGEIVVAMTKNEERTTIEGEIGETVDEARGGVTGGRPDATGIAIAMKDAGVGKERMVTAGEIAAGTTMIEGEIDEITDEMMSELIEGRQAENDTTVRIMKKKKKKKKKKVELMGVMVIRNTKASYPLLRRIRRRKILTCRRLMVVVITANLRREPVVIMVSHRLKLVAITASLLQK